MKMTKFCDHLYDETTDGYIQILKLDDKNNGELTIKIYNTKNDEYYIKTKEDYIAIPKGHLPVVTVADKVQSYPFPKNYAIP